jgi:hypothetical protein
MLGDGRGHFKSLAKKESGFFVPYDVKSLNVLHCSNRSLILAGCNNSALKVFDCGKSMEP